MRPRIIVARRTTSFPEGVSFPLTAHGTAWERLRARAAKGAYRSPQEDDSRQPAKAKGQGVIIRWRLIKAARPQGANPCVEECSISITPLSILTTKSHPSSVDSRWATMRIVTSPSIFPIPSMTSASV
jgi:hypothetical protein